MIPVVGDLIKNTIGKVVDKAVDRYLPASMSEKEKAEFRVKMRELAQKELEADMKALVAVNQTMQAEAKSEHWVQYTWRPLVGFTFSGTIIANYILLPILKAFGLDFQPIVIPSELWGAMLVVLGVSAWTRGQEKIKRGG